MRDRDAPDGPDAADATPEALRDGVRDGILAALAHERLRGVAVARRLAAAGAAAVAAAVALTLLFAGSGFDHGPHLAVCAALWTGLLVECFSLVLLRVQTPGVPIRQAAVSGLAGLALAAGVMAMCPEPHLWTWWHTTALGRASTSLGMLPSALCFGLCSALVVAAGASLVVAMRARRAFPPALPALLLALLLAPVAMLQPISAGFVALCVVGVALGSYLGVLAGMATARALLGRLGS
jgi:hypothetical protein